MAGDLFTSGLGAACGSIYQPGAAPSPLLPVMGEAEEQVPGESHPHLGKLAGWCRQPPFVSGAFAEGAGEAASSLFRSRCSSALLLEAQPFRGTSEGALGGFRQRARRCKRRRRGAFQPRLLSSYNVGAVLGLLSISFFSLRSQSIRLSLHSASNILTDFAADTTELMKEA